MAENNILVSVIVPVYNVENYIENVLKASLIRHIKICK